MSNINTQLDAIKYLCEDLKLNPEQRDGDGHTALQTAVLAGNLEIVKYLIEEQHANTQVIDQRGGYTLLHLAVISGNLDVVQYIMNHTQVDPEAKDKQNRTAAELTARIMNMIRETGANN